MNLPARLARLEKARALRTGGSGACALCGESGAPALEARFAEPGEAARPRPGCPRCGRGAVYAVEFERPGARSEVEA